MPSGRLSCLGGLSSSSNLTVLSLDGYGVRVRVESCGGYGGGGVGVLTDGVELLIEPCQLESVGTGMFAGTRGGKPGGRGGWSDLRVDTERIVVSVLTGRIVVFVSTGRTS